jgi:hypothetical protein
MAYSWKLKLYIYRVDYNVDFVSNKERVNIHGMFSIVTG